MSCSKDLAVQSLLSLLYQMFSVQTTVQNKVEYELSGALGP